MSRLSLSQSSRALSQLRTAPTSWHASPCWSPGWVFCFPCIPHFQSYPEGGRNHRVQGKGRGQRQLLGKGRMLTWHIADPRFSAWYSGWALSRGIPEHRTSSQPCAKICGSQPHKKDKPEGFHCCPPFTEHWDHGGGVSRSSGMGAKESINNPAWGLVRCLPCKH